MNIFVTGWKGRLGSSLVELGCIPFVADITSESEIEQEMENVKPGDCLINCAAKTGVDWCENHYADALEVNGHSVISLMDNLPEKASFIQLSTDYVFDGYSGPYSEEDEIIHEKQGLSDRLTEPINNYGWSKLAGEFPVYPVVPEQKGLYCTVRTTGLFGSVLPDLASYVVKKVHEKEEILVTSELVANQTFIPNLAKNLIRLAEIENKPPILNLASIDRCSRFVFARSIASWVFGQDKAEKYIKPCMNNEVPGWVAMRPTNSGLACDFARKIGFDLLTIADGIQQWISDFCYKDFPV